MSSTTDPLSNTTSYVYNGFGPVTSITEARGVITKQNQYDIYGNLMSRAMPMCCWNLQTRDILHARLLRRRLIS